MEQLNFTDGLSCGGRLQQNLSGEASNAKETSITNSLVRTLPKINLIETVELLIPCDTFWRHAPVDRCSIIYRRGAIVVAYVTFAFLCFCSSCFFIIYTVTPTQSDAVCWFRCMSNTRIEGQRALFE